MKEESLLLLSDLQKLINQVVLIDYTIIILGGVTLSVMTKEEFVRVVRGYTLHMYRLAYSILNNSTDAEDAVSEAVLHAYEKLRTLRDPDSFKNWILQITANEAKKIYRQNKRTGAVAWEENLSPAFYDEHHELWDAVMQLDGGYRDVIVLFYYEQCTIPEISRILECRQGTVKSRLYRAKEQLRERLI